MTSRNDIDDDMDDEGDACLCSRNQRQRKIILKKKIRKKDNQERLAKEELDSRDKHHKIVFRHFLEGLNLKKIIFSLPTFMFSNKS